MKRLAMALCFIAFITGHAHADALWYVLENGSKVDLTNGVSVDLTGRIALAECGGNKKGTKIGLPIYAARFDNLPDTLEPHVNDSNRRISLFGGTGSVDVSGVPVLIANREGKVLSIDWVLQHQLEQDYGNEAIIFDRLLQLDHKKKSSLSFQDGQSCPDKIELHAVARDIWSTYKPRLTTSAMGVQSVETITSFSKEETIGHITIIATAIPNSEEKIDDGIQRHIKLPEGPYIKPSAPLAPRPIQPPPAGKPLLPPEYRQKSFEP